MVIPVDAASEAHRVHRRYMDHFTDEDFILTRQEYAAVYVYWKAIFCPETGQPIKDELLGYKEWVDAKGVHHRIAVLVR